MIARAYSTPYYTMREGGAALGQLGRVMKALSGLGACGDCIATDDNGDCIETDTASCVQGTGSQAGPPPLPGFPTTSSPGSSVDWSKIGTSLASDFATIYKSIVPIPAGCTQIQTAQGLSVSCSGTQQAPSLGLNLGAGGMGSMLPLLLIGGVALLIFSREGR